jgi:hypothetical protein
MLAGLSVTRDRVAGTEGPLLGLHDTTECSFKRQEKAAIGLLRKLPMQSAFGMQVVACGILMHSSLVSRSGMVETPRL